MTAHLSRRGFLRLTAGAAALTVALPSATILSEHVGTVATRMTWADLVRMRDVARADARLTGNGFLLVTAPGAVEAIDPFRVFHA